MPLVSLHVHHSQFPENVRKDLLHSLQSRQVNHKFHYDSIKQANKWLALHEKYSPARTDPACIAIYDDCFGRSLERIGTKPISVIALGCGGGQKEEQFLKLMKERGIDAHLLAVDVSPSLVITAQRRLGKVIGENLCSGLVCDLETADDLLDVLDRMVVPGRRRVMTFFGLIPNFEPKEIIRKIAAVLHPDDVLLFSANLAPGPDYQAGVEAILPLYQNELTRDWLLTFLRDLGVEERDGQVEFKIEDVDSLKRIIVHFRFTRMLQLNVGGEVFTFQSGDSIRLFFSYRHTPEIIRTLLATEGIEVLEQSITPSQEEGVFLCIKTA